MTMAERLPTLYYCCEICGQEGLRDEEMRSHMLLAHIEGAVSCPFCDLTDISAEDMLLHVNSAHLDFLSPDNEPTASSESSSSSSLGRQRVVLGQEGGGGGGGGVGTVDTSKENDVGVGACGTSRTNRNYVFLPSSHSSCDNVDLPRRSRLSLDLRSVPDGRSSSHDGMGTAEMNGRMASADEGQVVNCPICGREETSPAKLEEHVNRRHFDLTSPSFPASVSPIDGVDGVFRCPLCVRHFQSGSDLELHVNMEHRDILSPSKTPRSTPGDENSNQRCPVCDLAGFCSAVEMASHIEEHFERKPTLASPELLTDLSADSLLAQEIERQEHEARKLQEQREFELLKAQYGMDNNGSFRDQSIKNMQKAVYSGEMSVADFYNRQVELRVAEMNGVDDGHSCSKDLIPKIRTISLSSNNNVLAVWLCTTVDHYGATYGDKGWGCGYRNIQMMLSSLMHNTRYNEKLFNGENSVPSISKIQELIEWSWRKGFDPQGCEQLGGKLCNTRKWIGATEVVTLLSSFRIRCQLVDFHCPTGPDGTHPELFQWVADYFTKQDDFKAPLYLQHQGHSRTIIGVEHLKDGSYRLLVFDPSHNRLQMEYFSSTASAVNGMRLLRRPLSVMKARHYQVVAVSGILETEQEFQRNKILRSIRIPRET